MADIDTMTDEEELHKMMTGTEDFAKRKQIRTRLKQIREESAAAWEKSRAEREVVDVVAMRTEQSKARKESQMKALSDKADEKRMSTKVSVRETNIKERQENKASQKQREIDALTEANKSLGAMHGSGQDRAIKDKKEKDDVLKAKATARYKDPGITTTKTEVNKDGVQTTTTTNISKSKDGSNRVTKQTRTINISGGLGGTSYHINKSAADDLARRISLTFNGNCKPETSGVVTVRTENWSSRDGNTANDDSTKSWGGDTARNAFKQLDNEESSGVNVTRSPSAIKQLLLEWTQRMTAGYEFVNVKNFSSSWNDGMAFSALIHHFYPRAFDYSKLNPKFRRGNFKLAFDVAQKLGDVGIVLDVDDMVKMKNPDWKCVFTQIQMYYKRFRNWDEEQAALAEVEEKAAVTEAVK